MSLHHHHQEESDLKTNDTKSNSRPESLLLIDLHDFSPIFSSRPPPDGHEFPPNFHDPSSNSNLIEFPETASSTNTSNVEITKEEGALLSPKKMDLGSSNLDPPCGFEDSGFDSLKDGSLTDSSGSFIFNENEVNKMADDKISTEIVTDVQTNIHEMTGNKITVDKKATIDNMTDDNEMTHVDKMPIMEQFPSYFVPTIIDQLPVSKNLSQPQFDLSAQFDPSEHFSGGDIFTPTIATTIITDETDSIDTLDSAVDVNDHELSEDSSSRSTNTNRSRTSSSNSNHHHHGFSTADFEEINNGGILTSSKIQDGDGRFAQFRSFFDDSKKDHVEEVPRKPSAAAAATVVATVQSRNVDEKNILSFKEKLAMFSKIESSSTTTTDVETSSSNTIGSSPLKTSSSFSKTMCPPELPSSKPPLPPPPSSSSSRTNIKNTTQQNCSIQKQNEIETDGLTKIIPEVAFSTKNDIMYRSLGNISNLYDASPLNCSNSSTSNDNLLSTTEKNSGDFHHHSSEEQLEDDLKKQQQQRSHDSLSYYNTRNGYDSLPKRSTATKRYSVGPTTFTNKEYESLSTGRQRSTSISPLPSSTSPAAFSSTGMSSSTSLYSLLESRRQQVSKLRGLVIPEKPETTVNQRDNVNNNVPIPLPIIKSSDSILNDKQSINSKLPLERFNSLPRIISDTSGLSERSSEPLSERSSELLSKKSFEKSEIDLKPSNSILSSSAWKNLTEDLPKYSPAFKRKQLSTLTSSNGYDPTANYDGNENKHVRSHSVSSINSYSTKSDLDIQHQQLQQHAYTVTTSYSSNPTITSSSSPELQKRSSPDSTTSSPGLLTYRNDNKKDNKPEINNKLSSAKLLTIPTNLSNEDGIDSEDRDSVISSVGSYLSQSLSPPMSPRDIDRRIDHRSPITVSNTCNNKNLVEDVGVVEEYIVFRVPNPSPPLQNETDDGSKKVKQKATRSDSIEAINRRNVLKLAKHSSGGSDDDVAAPANEVKSEDSDKVSEDNEKLSEEKSGLTPSSKSVSSERWAELEKKYSKPGDENGTGPEMKTTMMTTAGNNSIHRKFSHDETFRASSSLFSQNDSVDSGLKYLSLTRSKPSSTSALPKNSNNNNGGGSLPADNPKNFKALAEKWQQRSQEVTSSQLQPTMLPPSQPPPQPPSQPPSQPPPPVPEPLSIQQPVQMLPPTEGVVKALNKPEQQEIPTSPEQTTITRPIETRRMKISQQFEVESTVESTLPSLQRNRRNSKGDLLESLNDTISKKEKNVSSVRDLRKTFENQSNNVNGHLKNNGHVNNGHRQTVDESLHHLPPPGKREIVQQPPLKRNSIGVTSSNNLPLQTTTTTNNHARMSSLDSTASDSDFGSPSQYSSVTSLASNSNPMDQFGSITSLASSTSMVTPQELQQLIDEANQSLEESGTPQHEIIVVVLHRENVTSGSIGITLAGGADYESKEITVHKVISNSLADRDGRIQKGDRVLSINGKNMKGVTHRDALSILKTPRQECVLVLSRDTSKGVEEDNNKVVATGVAVSKMASSKINSGISSLAKTVEATTTTVNGRSNHSKSNSLDLTDVAESGKFVTVEVENRAGGPAFSVEGGKNSPLGDKPLCIKKIFLDTSCEKNSQLKVGSELISINGVNVTNMARSEAWNFMKKQPDGVMTILIRR